MYQVSERYEQFYNAVCVWNHKKNFTTFKQLMKSCAEPWAHPWQKPWFIIKNTINGNYKKIEKMFYRPIDKRDHQ